MTRGGGARSVAGPFTAAVAGALQKIDSRDGGKTADFFDSENSWPLDHAVYQKAMLRGVNLRNARVMAFVVERGWGNDPAGILQWRAAGGRLRIARLGKS